jgi:hypothetical protein
MPQANIFMRLRIISISSIMNRFPFARILCTKPNIGSRKTLGKTGKLHSNRAVLTDKVVKKIVCINKLNLPEVLIDIIKDYLFYSCDVVLHRELTQSIVRYNIFKNVSALVGETDLCVYEHHTEYCIREAYTGLISAHDHYRHEMIVNTCTRCGNYTNDYMYDAHSSNALCHCHDAPVYQSHDDVQSFVVCRL